MGMFLFEYVELTEGQVILRQFYKMEVYFFCMQFQLVDSKLHEFRVCHICGNVSHKCSDQIWPLQKPNAHLNEFRHTTWHHCLPTTRYHKLPHFAITTLPNLPTHSHDVGKLCECDRVLCKLVIHECEL